MKPLSNNKIYEDGPTNAQAIQLSPLKKMMSLSTSSMKQVNIAFIVQCIHRCIKTCYPLVCILLLACCSVFGKIKNGYEKNVEPMKESLTYLQDLLENGDLSFFKRRKVEGSIEALVNYLSYYELTENLLDQYKIIAPQLFSGIDTITDRLGRPVDVYVKFVPIDATEVKAWGITQVNQMENDKDAYVSEYGPFTVSIKIWVVSRALLVLSHEFGHVKYQVPNLASYMEFHKMCYKDTRMLTFIGHSPNDPSGKSANHFGSIFRQTYAKFLETQNEKPQSPAVLLTKIRKSLGNKYYTLVMKSRPIVNMM
jgi:hypothetical protein